MNITTAELAHIRAIAEADRDGAVNELLYVDDSLMTIRKMLEEDIE